ncbi:MAG TPA: alpha/beta hydrolase, partial [Microcoleus sp.]|nr:alpha/beta hydrolase [Microcoleus sp.]
MGSAIFPHESAQKSYNQFNARVAQMTKNFLLRNTIKVFGQGTQTMMFAHGFGCDQNMWRFVTLAFEKDYKIILFDYVGSGKSDISAYS